MPLLPSKWLVVYWGPGSWGGMYSHFSQYPLGPSYAGHVSRHHPRERHFISLSSP